MYDRNTLPSAMDSEKKVNGDLNSTHCAPNSLKDYVELLENEVRAELGKGFIRQAECQTSAFTILSRVVKRRRREKPDSQPIPDGICICWLPNAVTR